MLLMDIYLRYKNDKIILPHRAINSVIFTIHFIYCSPLNSDAINLNLPQKFKYYCTAIFFILLLSEKKFLSGVKHTR